MDIKIWGGKEIVSWQQKEPKLVKCKSTMKREFRCNFKWM